MLRGTRILLGTDADRYQAMTEMFCDTMKNRCAFEQAIVPVIWESETFDEKVGAENSNMMWRFKDKGDRNVCLVPEITGLVQEMWRNEWSKTRKTMNLFYVARCYR